MQTPQTPSICMIYRSLWRREAPKFIIVNRSAHYKMDIEACCCWTILLKRKKNQIRIPQPHDGSQRRSKKFSFNSVSDSKSKLSGGWSFSTLCTRRRKWLLMALIDITIKKNPVMHGVHMHEQRDLVTRAQRSPPHKVLLCQSWPALLLQLRLIHWLSYTPLFFTQRRADHGASLFIHLLLIPDSNSEEYCICSVLGLMPCKPMQPWKALKCKT